MRRDWWLKDCAWFIATSAAFWRLKVLKIELSPTRTSYPLRRSEEHTSELQSLMRISYAVFCLKKKKTLHHNSQQKFNRTTKTKHHNIINISLHESNKHIDRT